MPPDTDLLARLERAVRERGVRVEERLALLRRLSEEEGAERVRGELDERLRAARRAAERVKGELR